MTDSRKNAKSGIVPEHFSRYTHDVETHARRVCVFLMPSVHGREGFPSMKPVYGKTSYYP